jgi:hypothetical protein
MTVLAGVVAASSAASLAVMAAPAIGAAARADTWGKAMQVPGLARLSAGHGGTLGEVSCSSPGNCAAAGRYTAGSGHQQGFVVSENKGSWGTAIAVPRLAALNTGGNAEIMSLSCGSAGNCAIGGFYTNSSRRGRAFVDIERNGSWGKAMQVPGAAGLSGASGSVTLDSLSCPSAGNCSAGGQYSSDGDQQAFVVSEKNGSWGRAIEVPGLAALNNGALGGINSVSCASAGNCAATGTYDNGAPKAFVVSETSGSWGSAIEIPGGFAPATFWSVSCPAAGNCAAAGYSGSVTDEATSGPLVVSEKNGTWDSAIEVPGTTADGRSGAGPVSCASAGNCVAGGDYQPLVETPVQAFLVREKSGSWGTAFAVPGLAALNVDENAYVSSVSCKTAGNCSAGGFYEDGSSHQQAFVVSEHNGSWGKAIEVPGSGALNTGGSAEVIAVSCTTAGYCVAAGNYAESSGDGGSFLVTRS